jgi:hypothetical protein
MPFFVTLTELILKLLLLYIKREIDGEVVLMLCRGLKSPVSPGGHEKRGGTDSDRDSELDLDYSQCKFVIN